MRVERAAGSDNNPAAYRNWGRHVPSSLSAELSAAALRVAFKFPIDRRAMDAQSFSNLVALQLEVGASASARNLSSHSSRALEDVNELGGEQIGDPIVVLILVSSDGRKIPVAASRARQFVALVVVEHGRRRSTRR